MAAPGIETASLLRPEANDVIIRVNDVSDYAHSAGNLGSGTVSLLAQISIKAHPLPHSEEE
jgi:hypothetical protein